jgi:hypothetical protein
VDNVKHASLLRYGTNYSLKKFDEICPWLFFALGVEHRLGVVSLHVNPEISRGANKIDRFVAVDIFFFSNGVTCKKRANLGQKLFIRLVQSKFEPLVPKH